MLISSCVRLLSCFHNFFSLTQLFFLFICPFSSLLDFLFAALRVNKQRTRGPRFILFVSKINFSCLFCLVLICTFPKKEHSTANQLNFLIHLCESCLQSTDERRERVCAHTHTHLFSFGISKNSFASGNDAESCRTTFAESFFCTHLYISDIFLFQGCTTSSNVLTFLRSENPDELKI